MNNQRRKLIRSEMETLQDVATNLRDLASEEEEYRDSMPENLQGSDKYDTADTAANELTEVADELDSLAERLEEIL